VNSVERQDDETRELGLADSNGATILVVEDDADVRIAVVQILELSGYRVLSARDGHEALAALRDNLGIDLVFSDLVMPEGMSGLELAREAQRLRPDLKILLTSGYSARAVPGDSGPDLPLIKKPYRLAEVVRRIGEVLGRGSS
jgi:two-component system, cell cycle sensor histidine kinase and response regulator CckA